jgi:hypothetical protein
MHWQSDRLRATSPIGKANEPYFKTEVNENIADATTRRLHFQACRT